MMKSKRVQCNLNPESQFLPLVCQTGWQKGPDQKQQHKAAHTNKTQRCATKTLCSSHQPKLCTTLTSWCKPKRQTPKPRASNEQSKHVCRVQSNARLQAPNEQSKHVCRVQSNARLQAPNEQSKHVCSVQSNARLQAPNEQSMHVCRVQINARLQAPNEQSKHVCRVQKQGEEKPGSLKDVPHGMAHCSWLHPGYRISSGREGVSDRDQLPVRSSVLLDSPVWPSPTVQSPDTAALSKQALLHGTGLCCHRGLFITLHNVVTTCTGDKRCSFRHHTSLRKTLLWPQLQLCGLFIVITKIYTQDKKVCLDLCCVCHKNIPKTEGEKKAHTYIYSCWKWKQS